MPYFIVFELLGPTIECVGYALFVLALALGLVSLPFALAFFAVSLTYGLVLSFLVILMEERAFRRYPGWSDLDRLTLCAWSRTSATASCSRSCACARGTRWRAASTTGAR